MNTPIALSRPFIRGHILPGLITASLSIGAVGLAVAQNNASAWQSRADLMSSGAAASIIVFHVCEGEQGSRPVGERAHARLEQQGKALALAAGADTREVLFYLADATNLKVRALWQANQALSCRQTRTLREVASATGFEIPSP